MHATEPVHWLRWERAGFARAYREDKPIFVARDCHAHDRCHVMDYELVPTPDAHVIAFTEYTHESKRRQREPRRAAACCELSRYGMPPRSLREIGF